MENRDEILFYLGMYHTQSQYFQKSIEYYEQAHKLKPENPRYLLALATSFRQLGHNEEAGKYLRILINSHPESRYTDYALKIFQDFRKEEDPEKIAEKINKTPLYQAFAALNGKISLSDEEIIDILEKTRQWDQLIYFLEQKNTTGAERASHVLKLEQLYKDYPKLDFSYTAPTIDLIKKIKNLRSENREQEIIDFSEFVNQHIVFSEDVLEEIASSAIKLRKYEKAIEIYRKLLENGADKTACYSKIGYAYFMQNQLEKSLDSYYTALSYNPANPGLLFKLAELLKTIGEIPKARMIYEEIVQLNIDPQSVRDARFFLSQINRTD
jgi:tetratricopeptide (TPR) repeat protein